ncbi:MAG: HD domain-containing protein [Bacteroidetes bacterium]|nr:HD domain-containing protein [Bacteroidota bacterium]
MGKIKIFNDPVYGLIHIPSEFIFKVIEHPYFQRLRRIKQLGLTDLVYPGANHTRFHHTIGAVHLMGLALDNLKLKGVEISDNEYEAAQLAILLHDIGHGPFSHALENKLVEQTSHEEISLAFMQFFNAKYEGRFAKAISIFKGDYEKPFLCELVSGQLDVDRLDYLRRDSFYTGVSEGIIGADRIIKMMNVKDGHLVIEEKGIYSIEKFIIARNLMYWQVYLHKTVLCAEILLTKIIERAKELASNSAIQIAHGLMGKLLSSGNHEFKSIEGLDLFARIDDIDTLAAIKAWCSHTDPILSELSQMLINRQLPKVELHNQPIEPLYIQKIEDAAKAQLGIDNKELSYYIFKGSISNTMYHSTQHGIKILYKDGSLLDFTEACKQYDLNVLNRQVQKHYICYPKSLRL